MKEREEPGFSMKEAHGKGILSGKSEKMQKKARNSGLFQICWSTYAAQRAAFVPPPGGISCAAIAALSYALRADFITGLPVCFIERSDWFPLH